MPIRLLAIALTAALLAGCDARERWSLAAATSYPTALDYWQHERAFLAGSYHDGAIYRLPRAGGEAAPLFPALFPEMPPDRHRRALRLKVDAARNRLWVLDEDALYAYALPGGALLHRVPLPGQALPGRVACLPDLAVDRSTGIAYVSNAGAPVIHAVDISAPGAPPRRAEMAVRFDGPGPDGGFSALAIHEYPFLLIAGNAASGRLWRIDPRSGEASALPVAPVRGVCGLSLVMPEERPYLYRPPSVVLIYAATGFEHEVARIALPLDFTPGTVARVAPLMFLDTPVSLVAFSRYVVVPGTQLDRHPDFNAGGAPASAPPFRLVLMPTALESSLR